MSLEYIDFDLEQNIEQAVDMIALEAHKKSLYVAMDVSPEAVITMKGDPSKFREILINLVKNAVKFTNEGGVTVSARLVKMEKKEAVRVSVADTGIGIVPEARDRLFTTFMQADASATRRFGGTGLGLSISRNLVEMMQGRIEMIPNKGGGSIFSFTVPVENPRRHTPLEAPPKIRENPVLVIDNEEASRLILCSRLTDLGCLHVDSARSGEEALAVMRAAVKAGKPYRTCFVSMIMTVMDGWRLGAEIYNDSDLRDSSLILMVPHGLLWRDTKMPLLKWFKAYINMPVKRLDLAETLSSLDRGFAHNAEIPMILVAEDHLVNQKLLSMMLEKLSFRSVLANDGIEAVEKALTNPVELVFMDIQMPGMNGYEAAEKLRAMGFDKPVIAVTASGFSDEMEQCVKSGMSDIIIKPFRKKEIENMLAKWLNAGLYNSGEKTAAVTTAQGGVEPLIPVVEAAAARPFKTSENIFFPDEDAAVNRGNAPPAMEKPAEAGGVSSGAFNPKELFETFMDNDEMAISMLHRFIERTDSQIDGFPALVKNEDWENARREAHMIKGAAFTMAGKDLGKAAGRLEKAFLNMDTADIAPSLSSLRGVFVRFKSEAETFLSSRG